MKKILVFTSIILVLVMMIGVVACNPVDTGDDGEDGRYEIEEELVLSNDLDYTTVSLNEEEYPFLQDQGLTLVTGYDSDDYSIVNEVPADDEENIRNYFDPSKPNLIVIHGLQMNIGRYGIVHMTTENRREEVIAGISNKYASKAQPAYLSDAGFNNEHEPTKYWFDGANGQGYNVFYFHYERFSDIGPGTVVNDIWSRDTGSCAVYYDTEIGEYAYTEKYEATNGYSLAEIFVGEYLRAFKAIDSIYPEYKASGNLTYTAAHSMGGVMTVASSILIHQLAEKGAIDTNLLPSRHIQMDSYISLIGETPNCTIAWSGKNYVDVKEDGINQGQFWAIENYVSALKALVLRYNVAVDFYMNTGWIIPFLSMVQWDEEEKDWVGAMNQSTARRVSELCPIIIIKPYFSGLDGMESTMGHNSIREWVLSSYLYDAPTVTVDGKTYTVPTVNMSNEDVLALRGRVFEMCHRDRDGNPLDRNQSDSGSHKTETVRCDDDHFVVLR